jgi:predicted O-methyltransferase YrrM
MISYEEIKQIHQAHWKKGYGSISAKEAYFMQLGIGEHKPKRFLEVGTASGLSTGFIGLFMNENEGESILTIDYDTTFWMDRSEPTGYLAERIMKDCGPDVKIDFVRSTISTHVALDRQSQEKFDMAFIDANHQHPWPTLDMIAILPFMEPGAFIYNHDLALYKLQSPIFGIGPKYLFDQIPEHLRKVTSDVKENIFYVKTPTDYRVLEKAMMDALFLPWTLRHKIEQPILNKFISIARQYWSEELADAIQITAEKFNIGR